MTHCTTLLFLFATFDLALSSPTSLNFNDLETRILETPTFDKEDLNEANDVIIKKITQCSSNTQQDGPSDCSNDQLKTTDNEQSSTFSMLRNPAESYVEELEAIPYDSSSYALPTIPSYRQPSIPSPQVWTRSPYGYQVNPSSLEAIGVGIGNYGGVLYPHVHPKLLAAMNQGYTISSLPPVRSTYIHSTYPGLRQNYDIDVLNSQNAIVLPPNVRPVRMLPSSEEEFLAELEHDAIMNNIIPTMQVRYASSSPYSNEALVSAGPAIAVFPNAPLSSCAQPILLSCTPKITRGVLAQNAVPPESIQLQAAAAQHAYRQPVQVNEAVTKNNVSVDHNKSVNEDKSKLKKTSGGSE